MSNKEREHMLEKLKRCQDDLQCKCEEVTYITQMLTALIGDISADKSFANSHDLHNCFSKFHGVNHTAMKSFQALRESVEYMKVEMEKENINNMEVVYGSPFTNLSYRC
jgi:uncharacterized protein YjcR